MRVARWIAAVLALVGSTGCVTLPDSVVAEFRSLQPGERAAYGTVALSGPGVVAPDRVTSAATAPSRHEIVAASLPLEHGQIIVSEAGGAMSLFYSLFPVDYAPWVHAGVVAVEDGEAVVYEANGTFFPVPGLPPTATISGSVRRVGVDRFLEGKLIVGLYAPAPRVDRARLVAFARAQWQRGAPFDPYFDSDDTDALYCTELVALALAAGGEDVAATPQRMAHPSLAVARQWLRLRSDRVFLAGRLVADGREVGRWSPELSSAQIDAYFAAKHELHRRFVDDVRLGEVFRWTGAGMRLREPVQRFVDDALALVAGADLGAGEVAVRVERLARGRFEGIGADAGSVVATIHRARESSWTQPPTEPSSSTPRP